MGQAQHLRDPAAAAFVFVTRAIAHTCLPAHSSRRRGPTVVENCCMPAQSETAWCAYIAHASYHLSLYFTRELLFAFLKFGSSTSLAAAVRAGVRISRGSEAERWKQQLRTQKR